MTQTAITREPVAGRRLKAERLNGARALREAQALRYRVFSAEFDAKLEGAEDGLDRDDYDRHCAHIGVRDLDSGALVATTRLLDHRAAERLGRFYSEEEFHLSGLDALHGPVLEIGRTCVAPEYRNGATIAVLWGELAEVLNEGGYRYLMGCASIPMRDGGMQAKAVMQRLRERYLCTDYLQAEPKNPLPPLDVPENLTAELAAAAQGLHAPGRQDLRRALLGPGFPGRRRVHPAQARRTLPALRPPLQGSGLMARLRLLLRSARLLGLVALGLGLAAWVSLRERLPGADVTPLRQRLTRWWLARLCAALPFEVRVSGEAPRQPMLWVANHVSWTDIPLLGALAPLTFLSKAEVRAWPLAGWLAEKAGTLFIRRGSGDSRLINQRLAEQLHRGRNLLIFPEGTTTNGESLRTFHGRLMASALEAGVAVQPVAISYRRDGVPDAQAPFIGDDDLLSHLGRLLRGERGSVHIQLLEPIPSQGLDRAELARQAQQAVRLALFGTAATTQTRRAA